jgi:TonB family protein
LRESFGSSKGSATLVSIMRRRSSRFGWIAVSLLSIVAPICAQLQPLHPRGDSNPQEPLPDGVYRVGRDIKPPRIMHQIEPEFSEQARAAGYEGTCVLWLVVDSEGMPQKVKVTRPVGMGLDDKAIEAVQQWRFLPSLKDGNPVAVQINVEVSFHLYNQGDKKPKLFQKANAGDAKAQFEIAQILLGDPYLAKDDSKGFAFLEKAAKQGLPPAQFAMGDYFSSHKNDLVTAYVWYALARKNRYKESDQKLTDLAEKMTPEQLAEARRRADSDNPF